MTMTPQLIVEHVLATARRQAGHHDCVVTVGVESGAELRWANNGLTTNGTSWCTTISVVAFVAKSDGISTATLDGVCDNLDGAGLDDIVVRAFAEARSNPVPTGHGVLATGVEIGDWSSPARMTGPADFSSLTPALGEMFGQARAHEYEHFGYAENSQSSGWVGSNNGIRIRHDAVSGRVEMTGRSTDRTRSTWEGRNCRDFSTLDLSNVHNLLHQRLEWQKHHVAMPAGRYDTVLPSGAVGDLMATLDAALDARSAHEGRSVFSAAPDSGRNSRIGDVLSSVPVRLYSDPGYKGLEVPNVVVETVNWANGSVFDTGQISQTTNWIENGKLANLTQTRVTVEEGERYTPNMGNLIMEVDGASGSIEDLVAGVDNGLLLSSLWYIREVDPSSLLQTGLTRDGVYVIRNGEIIGSTNNFRFNESALDMLGRIKAAGSTEITQVRENAEQYEDVAMPPLVVSSFNMSSVSDSL